MADIAVTDSGFSPETLSVETNTLVTWTVASGDDSHVIRFTGTVPPGGNPNNPNSSTLTVGQKASTTFLQAGTFNYVDTLHAEHTGVVIVQ